MKTHQHLQNHNTRYIERIKEALLLPQYQANGSRGVLAIGRRQRDIHFNPFSSSQAFLPHPVSLLFCAYLALDDWTSLIPFLIFPDVIFSQPPGLFFFAHPPVYSPLFLPIACLSSAVFIPLALESQK